MAESRPLTAHASGLDRRWVALTVGAYLVDVALLVGVLPLMTNALVLPFESLFIAIPAVPLLATAVLARVLDLHGFIRLVAVYVLVTVAGFLTGLIALMMVM